MMNNSARRILYPLADGIFRVYGVLRAKHYDIRNTIVVASSPRGGSTWLAEIITTLPGYHMLWEPLHLANNPECTHFGFSWQNYLPPGIDAPSQHYYIQQILTGSRLSTRILTRLYLSPLRLLILRGYVVKFVNANTILSWMTDLFPVRAIFMIRHPCAVVASQMRHGAWSHLKKHNWTISKHLFNDYPLLKEVFERVQRPEELLAFEWVVQNWVPLQTRHPTWILTTYERLATRRETELERLFVYLGQSVPPMARSQLYRASATTVADSHIKTGKNPLTGWQYVLTPRQVDNILNVVYAVGMTCYSEALEPDYYQLGLKGC